MDATAENLNRRRAREDAARPASSLGHMPAGERWEFDASVADVFDDMLARSIPQYEVMRKATVEVAATFGRRVKTDPRLVVDLGCSRGEALARMMGRWGAEARYVGVEVSAPMREACERRFAGPIRDGLVEIRDIDLRCDYPAVLDGDRVLPAAVTLAVLTLQFIPIEHRLRVVRDAYLATAPGGCLVVVEKILGGSWETEEVLRGAYVAHKRSQGYGQAEIDRKALALEGVLVPQTAEANEAMLRRAGFDEVECYWRWMNFAAWVAIKRERTR